MCLGKALEVLIKRLRATSLLISQDRPWLHNRPNQPDKPSTRPSTRHLKWTSQKTPKSNTPPNHLAARLPHQELLKSFIDPSFQVVTSHPARNLSSQAKLDSTRLSLTQIQTSECSPKGFSPSRPNPIRSHSVSIVCDTIKYFVAKLNATHLRYILGFYLISVYGLLPHVYALRFACPLYRGRYHAKSMIYSYINCLIYVYVDVISIHVYV